MRALIRAALNERALERYILTWLGDASGLNTHYESWALVRDNEASNLMPSIAAGQFQRKFSIFISRSIQILKTDLSEFYIRSWSHFICFDGRLP